MTTNSNGNNPQPLSGFHYISQGFKLVTLPGIKRFVLLPLLLNIVLIGGAFWWLYSKLGEWIPTVMSYIPNWLQWLSYLLWPVAVITILLVFGYLFSTIANWIAAPFNGLLAEQLEAKLTGKTLPDSGFTGIIKDIPRIMKREWKKLAYYLPRALLLLLIYFIPAVGQILFPIVWFLFSAWMMSIQYNDYPFDNHKISFADMKSTLAKERVRNLQFGGVVNLLTMIPILNLFIMPVAVCGATKMWVDRYRGGLVRSG